MSIYGYGCPACGSVFWHTRDISATDDDRKCGKCGKVSLIRRDDAKDEPVRAIANRSLLSRPFVNNGRVSPTFFVRNVVIRNFKNGTALAVSGNAHMDASSVRVENTAIAVRLERGGTISTMDVEQYAAQKK